MTDFDAVYEDVMTYARTSIDKIDTQEKLRYFLRENDRGNKISDYTMEKLIESNAAQRDIENQRTLTERRELSAKNQEKMYKEKKEIREMQKKHNVWDTGKTVTDKKGERHEVYTNSKKQYVAKGFFFTTKTGKTKETARLISYDKKKGFKLTGRFAKKD